MKITINTDEKYSETEIIINCNRMGDDMEKLISAISKLDMRFTGIKNGEQYFIDIADIIYAETTDKRTFFYTLTDVFECPLKLYELEEKLTDKNFLRASKSCLFNLDHVKSLKSDLEQRLLLTMESGFKIIVSRQYSFAVKAKLEDYRG